MEGFLICLIYKDKTVMVLYVHAIMFPKTYFMFTKKIPQFK